MAIVAVSDTHAALWHLWDPVRLSANASRLLDEAAEADAKIAISAISVCEVVYLEEKGRIAPGSTASFVAACTADDALFVVVAIDVGVALRLPEVPRDLVPDMPDRIIAATALALGVPLVTKDAQIRSTQVPTIW